MLRACAKLSPSFLTIGNGAALLNVTNAHEIIFHGNFISRRKATQI